jgi:hypothetical protein
VLYIDACNAKLYYVTYKEINMIRTCVHISCYDHLVVVGECGNTIKTREQLLKKEIQLQSKATISLIAIL